MTIKKTQKNGLTITTEHAEIVLEPNQVSIKRKDGADHKLPVTIASPGEYEVAGVFVAAYDSVSGFLIETESFAIAYLSNRAQLDLSTSSDDVKDRAQLDAKDLAGRLPADLIEQTDVLILPGSLTALVAQFAPSLLIPTDNLEQLAEKLGVDAPAPINSLTLKKISDLPEEMELVNLG